MGVHNKRVLHVIDHDGRKCTIPFAEKVEDRYQFDVDWYLANGCVKLEDAFARTEHLGEVFKQTMKGDFSKFNNLPEKDKAMIMKHWPSNVWDSFRMQDTITDEEAQPQFKINDGY